jgi:hypothetical protein
MLTVAQSAKAKGEREKGKGVRKNNSLKNR